MQARIERMLDDAYVIDWLAENLVQRSAQRFGRKRGVRTNFMSVFYLQSVVQFRRSSNRALRTIPLRTVGIARDVALHSELSVRLGYLGCHRGEYQQESVGSAGSSTSTLYPKIRAESLRRGASRENALPSADLRCIQPNGAPMKLERRNWAQSCWGNHRIRVVTLAQSCPHHPVSPAPLPEIVRTKNLWERTPRVALLLTQEATRRPGHPFMIDVRAVTRVGATTEVHR